MHATNQVRHFEPYMHLNRMWFIARGSMIHSTGHHGVSLWPKCARLYDKLFLTSLSFAVGSGHFSHVE